MDWYYATGGEQKGPISQDELMELHRTGQVKDSDLVWNETMTDWVAYRTVPGLQMTLDEPEPNQGEDEAESPPSPPIFQDSSSPNAAAAAASAAVVAAGGGGTSVSSSSGTPSTEKVPSYLWQSIVAVVLCCWPAAVPAIIFGAKVQPLLQEGRVEEAKAASKNAKLWVTISAILALIMYGFMAIAIIAEEMG